jgi:hypothetical protein
LDILRIHDEGEEVGEEEEELLQWEEEEGEAGGRRRMMGIGSESKLVVGWCW